MAKKKRHMAENRGSLDKEKKSVAVKVKRKNIGALYFGNILS